MIAEDIIIAAHGTSTKNNPDRIADDATELLRVLNASYYGVYAIAARVNYTAFAVKERKTHDGTGWLRPTCAELIFRIELDATPDGQPDPEVMLVPFNEKDAEPGRPAVYELGPYYYPAGNPLDPDAAEGLTFFYSPVPTSFTTLGSSGDASWWTRHDPLLIADVGMYLARKDGRGDDLAAMSAERERALQLYVNSLEHANVMERRSFGSARYMPSYTVESLRQMLIGGPPAETTGGA